MTDRRPKTRRIYDGLRIKQIPYDDPDEKHLSVRLGGTLVLPGDTPANATSVEASYRPLAKMVLKQETGAKFKYDWEGAIIEVCASIHTGQFLDFDRYGAKAEAERLIMRWFEGSPAGCPPLTDVKSRAKRIIETYAKRDKQTSGVKP